MQAAVRFGVKLHSFPFFFAMSVNITLHMRQGANGKAARLSSTRKRAGCECVNSGGFLGIRGALAGIAPDLVCLIMGVKQDKEA